MVRYEWIKFNLSDKLITDRFEFELKKYMNNNYENNSTSEMTHLKDLFTTLGSQFFWMIQSVSGSHRGQHKN